MLCVQQCVQHDVPLLSHQPRLFIDIVYLHLTTRRVSRPGSCTLRCPQLDGYSLHSSKTTTMVNERPKQSGGLMRFFGGSSQLSKANPAPSQAAPPTASRATHLGIGLGKGAAGLGG